ncbi:hypothetical protein GCM10023232_15000 [Sphingosinicella ginsenosidimutans]
MRNQLSDALMGATEPSPTPGATSLSMSRDCRKPLGGGTDDVAVGARVKRRRFDTFIPLCDHPAAPRLYASY